MLAATVQELIKRDQQAGELKVVFGVVTENDWEALVLLSSGLDRIHLTKIQKGLYLAAPDANISTTKPFKASKLYHLPVSAAFQYTLREIPDILKK